MYALILTLFVAQLEVAPEEFFAPSEEVRSQILAALDGDAAHSSVAEAASKLEADWARVPQATALEDPMLEFDYFLRSSGGEGRYSVNLSQSIPWFGTRKFRGKVAESEANATDAAYKLTRLERIAEIKRAFAEYAFLDERTRIAMGQVSVLTSLGEIARSRYALGVGGQEDLLRIEMEEAKLQASYDCCALEKNALGGKLNEALGREAAPNPPFPQPMVLPPPPPPAPVVIARMRVANPMLAELEASIEAKDHEITLAKKKAWPDITVGVGYTDMKDVRAESRTGALLEAYDATLRLANPSVPMLPIAGSGATVGDRIRVLSDSRREAVEARTQGMMDLNSLVELENMLDNESMKDEVMVSAGINLPIWRKKIKAGIEEATHRKKAVEHGKRKTGVTLEGAAKMAIYGMEDGYRRLRLYDEHLLPQIKRTHETLQGAYAAGNEEGNFLDVMTTVQAMLQFEQERAQAIRDIHVAAADLELIMGGPWSSDESAEPAPFEQETNTPNATKHPEPEG